MNDESLKEVPTNNDNSNGSNNQDMSFMTAPMDHSATAKQLDMSFMTVLDSSSHHNMASNTNILDESLVVTPATTMDECDVADLPKSGSAGDLSTGTPINVHGISKYERVKFHDEVGRLILESSKIMFQAYDARRTGTPPRGSKVKEDSPVHYPTWRWKRIQKHQISPSTSAKTLLKLVSMDNPKKAVTFTLPSKEELDKIRKDISARLKHVKKRIDTDQTPPPSPHKDAAVNDPPKSDVKKAPTEATPLLATAIKEFATDSPEESSPPGATTWIGIVLVSIAIIVVVGFGFKLLFPKQFSNLSNSLPTLPSNTPPAALRSRHLSHDTTLSGSLVVVTRYYLRDNHH